MSFEISPSESFLLGLCLEEYAQARQDDQEVYFFDIVPGRLRSFIPDMRLVSQRKIAEEDLPLDIEWEFLESPQIGRSPSHPNTTYSREDDYFVELSIDRSRKSLVDLIIGVLDDALARSPYDNLVFPRSTCDLAVYEAELLRSIEASPADYITLWQRAGHDQVDVIGERLTKLCRENQVDDLFDSGRQFGRLFANCNRFDYFTREWWDLDQQLVELVSGDIRWEPMSPVVFFNAYQCGLKTLSESKLFADCNYSELLLRSELVQTSVDAKQLAHVGDEDDLYIFKAVARLACVRFALGTLVGEGLASLRMKDVAVHKKDAESHTPRMFAIGRESPSNRIGGQLLLIEREMNERTSTNMLPEAIVAMLGNSLEALTREVWPECCEEVGRRGGLPKVWDQKKHFGSEKEQRFAQIANMLYRTYRISAEHKSNKFRCTYDEARFFVNGVRALYDLSKHISTDER